MNNIKVTLSILFCYCYFIDAKGNTIDLFIKEDTAIYLDTLPYDFIEVSISDIKLNALYMVTTKDGKQIWGIFKGKQSSSGAYYFKEKFGVNRKLQIIHIENILKIQETKKKIKDIEKNIQDKEIQLKNVTINNLVKNNKYQVTLKDSTLKNLIYKGRSTNLKSLYFNEKFASTDKTHVIDTMFILKIEESKKPNHLYDKPTLYTFNLSAFNGQSGSTYLQTNTFLINHVGYNVNTYLAFGAGVTLLEDPTSFLYTKVCLPLSSEFAIGGVFAYIQESNFQYNAYDSQQNTIPLGLGPLITARFRNFETTLGFYGLALVNASIRARIWSNNWLNFELSRLGYSSLGYNIVGKKFNINFGIFALAGYEFGVILPHLSMKYNF